jgi:hypothetical protein
MDRDLVLQALPEAAVAADGAHQEALLLLRQLLRRVLAAGLFNSTATQLLGL